MKSIKKKISKHCLCVPRLWLTGVSYHACKNYYKVGVDLFNDMTFKKLKKVDVYIYDRRTSLDQEHVYVARALLSQITSYQITTTHVNTNVHVYTTTHLKGNQLKTCQPKL